MEQLHLFKKPQKQAFVHIFSAGRASARFFYPVHLSARTECRAGTDFYRHAECF